MLSPDEPNLLRYFKEAGYQVQWHDLIDPAALPPLRPAGLAGKPDFHELIRQPRRLDELDDAVSHHDAQIDSPY